MKIKGLTKDKLPCFGLVNDKTHLHERTLNKVASARDFKPVGSSIF